MSGNLPTTALPRAIQLIAAVLLTVSAITPASSMFIIIPGAISQAGTGVIYSLLIAACIGAIMALVYSELASAYPSAGGEYVMVAKVLGLWQSYIALILNAGVMMLISAVLALGAGDYFSVILPDVAPKITALVIIALSTIFGVLNIRLNAWITGAFLLVEIACIAFFMYLASNHIVQAVTVFWPPTIPHDGVLEPSNIGLIMFATATVVFAFNGYEQAVYLTEEIKEVRRTISKVIILSLFFSLILESIPTALLLLGSSDEAATLSSKAPFQDLVKDLGGIQARKYMSVGISIAVLNACIVNILMTARFVYSTARDGFWGARIGRRLSRISAAQGTPWMATLFVGFVSAAACFIDFNYLLVLTGTGLIFVYCILCICVIVGRYNHTTDKTQFRVPLFPMLPTLGIIALVGIAIANWQDPEVGRPSLYIAAAEAVFALIIYFVIRHVRRDAPMHIVEPD